MPVPDLEFLNSWSASARNALIGALDAIAGRRRAVVTLDFDNTCLSGDLGENLHYHLCESLSYAFDDGFLETIEPPTERERVRRALARRDTLAPDSRRALSLDLAAVYSRRYQVADTAQVYGWACTMHAGMTPEAVEKAALETLRLEQERERSVEEASAPDGITMRMSRGIRFRKAIIDLIAALSDRNAEVWLVSATNEWAVQAAAPLIGVPRERVIGNRCAIREGRICIDREGPTTYRQGKVDAINARIGVRPVFSMGDSWTDAEMLSLAEHAVLVDRGDESLRSHALGEGWGILSSSALSATDVKLPIPVG